MSASAFSPTPVDSRKRADQVREGITAMIRAGQLQDGDKLPTETQLAAMFGVGRSSVRGAVQSLVGLGHRRDASRPRRIRKSSVG